MINSVSQLCHVTIDVLLSGDSSLSIDTNNKIFLAVHKFIKVSKGAKIRNRYNQVPHLTQDTNGNDKLTVSTTNESQEVSPFPAGDH